MCGVGIPLACLTRLGLGKGRRIYCCSRLDDGRSGNAISFRFPGRSMSMVKHAASCGGLGTYGVVCHDINIGASWPGASQQHSAEHRSRVGVGVGDVIKKKKEKKKKGIPRTDVDDTTTRNTRNTQEPSIIRKKHAVPCPHGHSPPGIISPEHAPTQACRSTTTDAEQSRGNDLPFSSFVACNPTQGTPAQRQADHVRCYSAERCTAGCRCQSP